MRKILIVDDEFLARCSLKSQIASFSDEIEIIETDSGDEAVELYRRLSPDVVFMDVTINGTNGLVASRRIMDIDPRAKIFIVTEYDYFSYAQEAISIGIKEYILKPAPTEKIYQLLKKNFPGVRELENPAEREDREDEAHRLDTMGRTGRMVGSSTFIFSGAQESDFLTRLTLHDFKSAQKEGQVLLKNYFDTAADIDELKENINEFFVMLKRAVKNMLGKRPEGNIYSGINSIMQETDKGVILKKAMLEFDSILTSISESNVMVSNELRQRLMSYLNTNTSYNLSLDELAGALGVSTTYLSRKFKDWMGSSFSIYMTNRRMEYAKKLLLTTGESVKSISFKVGYNDSNYFCRVFKKCTGRSPAFYRSVHM